MTRKITFIIALLAICANIQAQRTCGSELNLTELKQADPARHQRAMLLENSMQQTLRSTGNLPTSTIIIPVVVM